MAEAWRGAGGEEEKDGWGCGGQGAGVGFRSGAAVRAARAAAMGRQGGSARGSERGADRLPGPGAPRRPGCSCIKPLWTPGEYQTAGKVLCLLSVDSMFQSSARSICPTGWVRCCGCVSQGAAVILAYSGASKLTCQPCSRLWDPRPVDAPAAQASMPSRQQPRID